MHVDKIKRKYQRERRTQTFKTQVANPPILMHFMTNKDCNRKLETTE